MEIPDHSVASCRSSELRCLRRHAGLDGEGDENFVWHSYQLTEQAPAEARLISANVLGSVDAMIAEIDRKLTGQIDQIVFDGRERVAMHRSSIARLRRHLQVIELAPKNMRREQAVFIFLTSRNVRKKLWKSRFVWSEILRG
ncbi:hypothetical protein [Burkholderia ubonensis]|uniref:hypothetical protein n=1 Tax=Burkholderia ubonensis TaxID=101571 RepID=UPI001E5F9EAB|nr:hypothetical protein [Burkholderia ubonensis]